MTSPIRRVTRPNAAGVIGFIEEDRVEAYQERVIKEKAALDEKIKKLGSFIDKSPITGTLPKLEQSRLCAQFFVMTGYSAILADRIAAFKEA